ncbi:MAG TPA: hypothetical protein VG733_17380 [Chthoniobacteraceae bacterium]|nr:hypothetical protein [Chthoniobacteraceae bacterium]
MHKIALLLALFFVFPLAAKAQQQLTIVKAVYAGGNVQHDVTSVVAGQIQNGRLKIHVNNHAFGGDVNPGTKKTLTVDYRTADGEFTVTANEGKDLEIPSPTATRVTQTAQPAPQAPQQPQLTIVKADYFAGDAHSDLTSLLTANIQDGARIQMHVSNRALGVDPNFGPQIVKTLTVDYKTPDGEFTLTAREGDTLKIPNPKATRVTQTAQPAQPAPQAPRQPPVTASNQTPPSSNAQQPLTIVKAVYASGDVQRDVTSLITGMIRGGQIITDVNNDKLGGDPNPGKSKILTVDYRTAAGEFTLTATEGQTLVIPNPKATPVSQRAQSAAPTP